MGDAPPGYASQTRSQALINGWTRRSNHLTPPIRRPTPFALPPHQGEPWGQGLFHTLIPRLTSNTRRCSQQQPAPFSWSVCVRQRGRNCLPDVTGLACGFFSYRRQPLEPLIRILRTPTSLRLSADNSPDAFRVRPRPRDPVRHAQVGLVIQLGGRSRQAAPTFPQLPGAILRAFK